MITNNMKRVIFIGGWNSAEAPYNNELELLSKCYPGAVVRRFFWNSNTTWGMALTIADQKAADDLSAQLNIIPSDELAKTVVVGHSLGARIAINAVRNCKRRLGELVIMGSAIDYDSPSVEHASKNVLSPIINIYSTSDIVLKFYQFYQGKKAFGSQGVIGNYTTDIQALFSTSDVLQALFRPDFLASLLIPGVGISRAIVTVPLLIHVVDTLKSYVLHSHSIYEYIKAWLDYEPSNAHLTLDAASSAAIIPNSDYVSIINTITSWYCSNYPNNGGRFQEDIQSMVSSGKAPLSDPLNRIERIMIYINQISPDLYDWNVVIDTLDRGNKCIPISTNLALNRDRDFMPRSVLDEFLEHNCQYLDCIVYQKNKE